MCFPSCAGLWSSKLKQRAARSGNLPRAQKGIPFAKKGQVYFGRLFLLEFETFRSVKAYLW